MGGEVRYPFEPRSTAHMRAGQFWDVPLSNGRFACGRVLFTASTPGVAAEYRYAPRTAFVGGLLDWCGDELPTSDAIAGCGLIDIGSMHVVAIQDTASKIRGWRDLADDGLVGIRHAGAAFGGSWYIDGCFAGPAPGPHPRDVVLDTWGRGVIKDLAESRFA